MSHKELTDPEWVTKRYIIAITKDDEIPRGAKFIWAREYKHVTEKATTMIFYYEVEIEAIK